MNSPLNNKAKKQQYAAFWLCYLWCFRSFIMKIKKIWRSSFQLTSENIFFLGNLILHISVRFLIQFRKHFPELYQINNKNRTSFLLFTIPASISHFTRFIFWETDLYQPGFWTIINSSMKDLTSWENIFCSNF